MALALYGWTHVEHVMGMAVSIDVRDVDRGDPNPIAAIREVTAWLHWVDATFSTYLEDSEVRRLARGELDEPSPALTEILALADDLRARTDGYFDVYATGQLDPSGIVKGWSIERASAILVARGVTQHSINAGGDIRARGRAWRVGIADPHLAGGLATVVVVEDGAVATSGIAERGAHVINPHTGRAALDLASVTVVGPDLTWADGYATAALAMGDEARSWLEGLAGHESYVIDAAGATWHTAGWGPA